MNSGKILLIALILFVIGAVICGIMFAISGFDPEKLSNVKYETITTDVDESFKSLSINLSTDDLEIIPTEDGKCKVVYDESEDSIHNIKVDNDTLTINVEYKKKFHFIFDADFKSPKITLYIPKKDYENVNVKSSTGEITIKDLNLKDLTIDVSTGDVTLSNVIASGAFNLSASTGEITFNACDATTIKANASTGDITGTLLSGKNFSASSSTGDVNVPASSEGGSCELKTSTGDIDIKLAN
ncbi:MAG: DUF4097 family beta strand repeat protein [Lachnospiraceae bacterium]|nr:DUF4097 family beta strand repeat protein [Lachnospiraceae bacterium]